MTDRTAEQPLHEQGRVPPIASPFSALGRRLLANRHQTARRNDSPLHRHTRDCRDPKHRARIARAHETLPARSEGQ